MCARVCTCASAAESLHTYIPTSTRLALYTHYTFIPYPISDYGSGFHDDDMYSPERHLRPMTLQDNTPGQRGQSPPAADRRRHSRPHQDAQAHNKRNIVPQSANPTQTACAHSRKRAQPLGQHLDTWTLVRSHNKADARIVPNVTPARSAPDGLTPCRRQLAFTRYSFGSRPLYTNQYYHLQTAPLFGHTTPTRHCPHYCAIQCFPPTILYCNTCHTTLVTAISC